MMHRWGSSATHLCGESSNVPPRGYPLEYPLTWCLGVTLDPEDANGSIRRALHEGDWLGLLRRIAVPLFVLHAGMSERRRSSWGILKSRAGRDLRILDGLESSSISTLSSEGVMTVQKAVALELHES